MGHGACDLCAEAPRLPDPAGDDRASCATAAASTTAGCKAAGFEYLHTTRETVIQFGEHLRLGSVLRGVQEPYRYEKEVEDFLRWSPSVRDREAGSGEPAGTGRKLRSGRK